jgi:adenylate cyclase
MSQSLYKFGQWTLDCEQSVLTSASGDVTLRPKSFEILRFLVENAGRLVSRDELLTAVWPGINVTEESLTQCVSEIRGAMRDGEQRIIKTVPKRGYLFGISVERGLSKATAVAEEPAASRQLLDGPSVAVLPFINLSGDRSQEYLSDGITEDILNGLSCFSDLSVIARNSSFSYKDRAIDVREISRQLGVRYLVEGSVRRFGDRLRITAQLVDAVSGVQRWAERFDREIGDVFMIQDEITRSIVPIVVAHLRVAEGKRAASKPMNSWTAYDLLMKGDQALRAYEQTWEPNCLFEARRRYAEAQQSDPQNARICAMLALTFVRGYADPYIDELGSPDIIRQGYDLISSAVGLEPDLPLARAVLGWTLFWLHEPEAAVREYEKAFGLNPNFSDWRFPAVVAYAGEPARALNVARDHLRLDPFHPPHLHAFQGHALYMLKQYAEALIPLRESIRRGPHVILGHVWLAATLVRLKQHDEARAIVADVRQRAPLMTLERWRAPHLYRHQSDSKHMTEALAAAGFV